MNTSKIERLICDKEFSYLQPYFYNNQYALRCELGIGKGNQYMINAKNRATEIFNILFPFGADAIIFDYFICDHSESGEAEKFKLTEEEIDGKELINNRIKSEANDLRFLLEKQFEYRHYTVKDLPIYDEIDDEIDDESTGILRRNRIICYRDDNEFDYNDLIDQEINCIGHGVGFVSFYNECILSIFDDRGCDIVFATYEKFKEFYHKLEPYFLRYDIEIMRNRLNG